MAVCSAANYQGSPRIVADGAGGAIIAWEDARSLNMDIYAQRVNGDSVSLWTPNGVALCNAANNQSNQMIVSDGAGGAIVTWQDYRSGTNYDIYAKRLYASSGLPVPGAPTISVNFGDTYAQIVWTGRGDEGDLGTPLRWVVYMNGDSVAGGSAQAPGIQHSVWKFNLSSCSSYDVYVKIVAQDGFRTNVSNTVNGNTCCGQQCEETRSQVGGGKDGTPRSYSLALAQPHPNPAKDATEIRWSIPQERTGERFQLAVFDVSGRKVATLAQGKAEAGSFAVMLRPRETASFKSGAYFVRLQIRGRTLTRSLILGR